MAAKELKFVRYKVNGATEEDLNLAVQLFNSIPRYLFEQIKDHDYDIDKLYNIGPFLLINPYTYFYVLVDEVAVIKGLLWAEHNLLNDNLQVHILSMDKEIQSNDGNLINMAMEHLNKIKADRNITGKLEMVTRRPKMFEEKYKWSRSDKILLEI